MNTMKKTLTLFVLSCLLILSGNVLFAQGLETFANYPENTNAYRDGTFAGLDGSTWNYFQCRGDSVITAPTPTLGKNRTPTAEVRSGALVNGVGTLSFDYRQVFSTDVALNVLVNDILITTVTTTGQQGITKNSGAIAVNVSGNVTLKFIQASTAAGQVAIDNITWTAFGGGTADPEPTNYPTAFAASGDGLKIKATWTDATGTQLPASYLVRISTSDNITAPVDGTYVGDDLDISDGSGSKSIIQGTQQYIFDGLEASKNYFLKIFPFTNSGSIVDYKTDGTAPSASARTQAILLKTDFQDGQMAPWTEFSVTGDQKWITDTISGNIFLRMSGYVGGTSFQNQDWLISPSLTLAAGSSPKLEFKTAMKFGTAADKFYLMVSTNYSSGDPTTATWTDLTSQAAFSTGNYTWVSSGSINLSAYEGANTRIAFKYDCGTDNVPTWEVDDVYVTFNSGVGFNNSPEANQVGLYPNPCTTGFQAQIKGNDSYLLRVFSTSGALMLEKKIERTDAFVSTRQLSNGVYVVEMTNLSSLDKTTQKLIVK